MKIAQLPPQFQARFRQERRRSLQAANNFARVCAEGDAGQLYHAHLLLNEQADAWRPAMRKVAKLQKVSPEIQQAFLPIWVESKHVALQVGNRRVCADALRVLLPGGYQGPPLTLYRGTGGYGGYRRRVPGFSWTTEIATARIFAQKWTTPLPSGPQGEVATGVILRTVAPPEAVLLLREPEDYYDEGEVVVDPYRLGKVELFERLPGTIAPPPPFLKLA